MSALSQILLGGLGGGRSLHDYNHASKIFVTNNYSRSPKPKWMFQVNFVLDPENSTFDLNPSELSYMVKSVDLPKFTMEVKEMNQYNRHAWSQTRIKYEPISIKFHDDNINQIREFWRSYYTYYFTDGSYYQTDYAQDDRYLGTPAVPGWGMDSGASGPFLSSIEIYSLFGGHSNKITLMNPVIISFSHDQHNQSSTQEFMEATMQIRYTGVVYEQGYAAGISGFGVPNAYDTSPSYLSDGFNGMVVDPRTGGLVYPTDQFMNPATRPTGLGPLVPNYSSYQPSSNLGYSPGEIQNILNNQNRNLSAFSFPVANTPSPVYSHNNTYPTAFGAQGYSNGQVLTGVQYNPYSPGSIQDQLLQRGYTQGQISSAISYINTIPQTQRSVINLLEVAETFINNPDYLSTSGSPAVYGQITDVPTNINFNDPTNSINPIYNSEDWKTQLANKGYSSGDIKTASDHISSIRVSPGTDLTGIAEEYLAQYYARI